MIKKIFLVVIYVLTITACNKQHNEVNNEQHNDLNLSGIYVAGYQINQICSEYCGAMWKNGTKTLYRYSESIVKSVYVTNSDVYVAGSYMLYAALWKNDKLIPLTDYYNSEANSVYVFGDDVYVVGASKGKATLWKNGVPTILSTSYSVAYSVFVSGGDVYVAGIQSNSNSIRTATLWKNGEPTFLVDTSQMNDYTSANSVVVSDGVVYVAGVIGDKATLWKNGEPTTLSNLTSEAKSVFVSSNDVYVAGYNTNIVKDAQMATLWKNGEPTFLADTSRMNSYTYANSVFVSGGDVYVVGEERYRENFNDLVRKATIWKNGVQTALYTGRDNTMAYSVFVK